jgi:hypothetical protein
VVAVCQARGQYCYDDFAFLLRSAQRLFISSDNLFLAAGLILPRRPRADILLRAAGLRPAPLGVIPFSEAIARSMRALSRSSSPTILSISKLEPPDSFIPHPTATTYRRNLPRSYAKVQWDRLYQPLLSVYLIFSRTPPNWCRTRLEVISLRDGVLAAGSAFIFRRAHLASSRPAQPPGSIEYPGSAYFASESA